MRIMMSVCVNVLKSTTYESWIDTFFLVSTFSL